MRRIYLDHAATTPLDPSVRAAMLPFLEDTFGNPSSVHGFGQGARAAIDQARDRIADALGCHSSEIYFTSGGTEADNTALLGVLLANRNKGDHFVTTTIEHHAVLDCARFAEKVLGFHVTYVSPDGDGIIDPERISRAMTERTVLVSVMHANNEIGTLQPIEDIAHCVQEKGVYFHTDAVQTLGYLPLRVEDLRADLVSLSAHKVYGPKGIGALYARRGTRFHPWLHGGQQEREKRAGTENVAGIVGFGRAVELLPTWRDAEALRIAALRDRFTALVRESVPDARLNGHPTLRLPGNINLSFPNADGESLLLNLDMRGIAASSGSACASGSIDPSHVLLALGLPLTLARTGIRFSLGRSTSEEDILFAADAVAAAVHDVRS